METRVTILLSSNKEDTAEFSFKSNRPYKEIADDLCIQIKNIIGSEYESGESVEAKVIINTTPWGRVVEEIKYFEAEVSDALDVNLVRRPENEFVFC